MSDRNRHCGRADRAQATGMLIQYMQDLSAYLQKRNIAKKIVTLAAAVLALTGLLEVRYSNEGDLVPASAAVGTRELPIYCVQTDEPKIALTFDVAWDNGDTQQIMEILKKHDVKAAFFMTGGWVDTYPDDAKMILAEGD